ncbi:MAG: DNA-binding protein WhiA [Oscillospiraceae bacterium]|nr:DNA-binding protein WhiA [Oscillospiraceae bacterium]
MSFSEDIKKRLCGIENDCPFCPASELAGIMEFAGRRAGGEIRVVTENTGTAQRLRLLIKGVFGFDISCRFNENKNSHTFVVSNENMTENIISALYLFTGAEKEKNEEVSPFDCCKGAYIRGAFLGGGSVSDPKKRYHLEFDTKNKSAAEYLCRVLALDDIPVKVTVRKNHYITYTKSSEVIADILGRIHAYTAVMDFYNISAEKEIRNDINRRVNCETANMDKTARASVKHIEAIERIRDTIGLETLTETLWETARARMEYPEESLAELAVRLGVGKSGVNHRLAKLMEMAEDLK